ncbi:MAG TPA: hypothetical protein VGY56_01245 [Verrucomicrobiae bacterium]|nr:hypothetical protein [Verrucomicrobiae bacterium]
MNDPSLYRHGDVFRAIGDLQFSDFSPAFGRPATSGPVSSV